MIKQNQHTATTKILKDNKLTIIKLKPIDDISKIKKTTQIYKNDRFSKETGICETKCDITIINPVTKQDISKYMPNNKIINFESFDNYKSKIPKIIKQYTKWINNILTKKTENNNIIYEDNDIVFLPDLKWNRINLSEFYGLVIVKNRNLKSIRDLEKTHITLLENIYKNISNVIKKKYNIDRNRLRFYFHYPPSFWHLHIHVNLIQNSYNGVNIEYCWNLHNVIQCLKIDSLFFKKISIEIVDKIV